MKPNSRMPPMTIVVITGRRMNSSEMFMARRPRQPPGS